MHADESYAQVGVAPGVCGGSKGGGNARVVFSSSLWREVYPFWCMCETFFMMVMCADDPPDIVHPPAAVWQQIYGHDAATVRLLQDLRAPTSACRGEPATESFARPSW